jgi:hypothetical protein
MTTLVEGQTPANASSRTSGLVALGIVLAVAVPIGLGFAADLMRASLCAPDAWACAAHGRWALILARAIPYLAVIPPLLILVIALARSTALASRVLMIYGAVFFLSLTPLWMLAAASYYSITANGIVRQDGPLGVGRIYFWGNVIQVDADCSARMFGDARPEFKLTLIDGSIVDAAAADGFVAHYPALSAALAASSFIYNNKGAQAHCPAPYLELFRDKPGARS